MKFNFIDRFLIKFVILLCLVLTFVVMDYFHIINFNYIRTKLKTNINIYKITKSVDFLNNDVCSTSNLNDYILTYENGVYRVEAINQNYITALKSGLVLEKTKNTIKVQTIDNEIFEYKNINDISVRLYEEITCEDIIATFTDYYILSVYKDGRLIEYYKES